jgi:hypothetical protein
MFCKTFILILLAFGISGQNVCDSNLPPNYCVNQANILLAFGINGQNVYDSNAPPNYCVDQAKLCQYQGGIHFACNKTRSFAQICSSDAAQVKMTPIRIDRILEIHNSLRNKLAAGNLTGGLNDAIYSPAIRMSTIKWSEELADLALLNAYQCNNQHDLCHNTGECKLSMSHG